MAWSIGYDTQWNRDIGYGVPAFCDYPCCRAEIDRGLSHVCGGEPYGGEQGCGLYFCGKHLVNGGVCQMCERCDEAKEPFNPTPDHPEWIAHKLTDESWKEWRELHPKAVETMNE